VYYTAWQSLQRTTCVWTRWNVTSSLRVYFVKCCQTTHRHVCYVSLSRSTCRIRSDHSWTPVVRKGKTMAFHTLDIVFKSRHTQCGIFCMPSPFIASDSRDFLCMRIADSYCCSDPTVCSRPPQPTVTIFSGASSGEHGNATVWVIST
jgi:hypothetical protein